MVYSISSYLKSTAFKSLTVNQQLFHIPNYDMKMYVFLSLIVSNFQFMEKGTFTVSPR